MGRKPIGTAPMTDAERQRRCRAHYRAKLPAHGTVQEFRSALLRFVETWRSLHPKLTTEDIEISLNELGLALRMDEYLAQRPTMATDDKPHWVLRYLNRKNPYDKDQGENWR